MCLSEGDGGGDPVDREHERDARCETTQRVAGRIDHEPLSLCLAGLFGEPGALLRRHHGRLLEVGSSTRPRNICQARNQNHGAGRRHHGSASGASRISLTASPGTSWTSASSESIWAPSTFLIEDMTQEVSIKERKLEMAKQAYSAMKSAMAPSPGRSRTRANACRWRAPPRRPGRGPRSRGSGRLR